MRTEHIYLKPDKQIASICHLSNNLYNEANYLIRQRYFKHKEFLYYNIVHWLIKDVKQSQNYQELGAKTAQQILRLLDQNWKSFFASRDDWYEHPEKYKRRPNLPKYRKKNGEFQVLFNSQQIRIQKTSGLFSMGKAVPKIKTRLPKETVLKQARILPQQRGYLLEIVYEIEIPELTKEPERIASIDLGQDNLATMVNNFGEQPIVIEGKPVKALNQ